MKCRHNKVKFMKHLENHDVCIHCLKCGATWSDPSRGLHMIFDKFNGVQDEFVYGLKITPKK